MEQWLHKIPAGKALWRKEVNFSKAIKQKAWLKNNKHTILMHVNNHPSPKKIIFLSFVFLYNNLFLCQISKQKLVSIGRENRLNQTMKRGVNICKVLKSYIVLSKTLVFAGT